jgi:hypothetical protein
MHRNRRASAPLEWHLIERGIRLLVVRDVSDAGSVKWMRMHWTFDSDSYEWLFEASFGDVRVSRRYPEALTRVETEEEANRIAPALFQMAEAWLRLR